MRAGSVESRLGDLLKEKKIKVGDLRNKWDADGNGKLTREEFDSNIAEIGFAATEEEMTTLFTSFDQDQSGALASKELVAALGQLLKDSQNKNAREQALIKSVAEKQRSAVQLQDAALKIWLQARSGKAS